MAIISEEELERRIKHENNLLNILGIDNDNGNGSHKEEIDPIPQPAQVEHKKLHIGGKPVGTKNLPQEVRALVGTLAHLDTAKNVAEAFGLNPDHVHHLKHGRIDKSDNLDLKNTISSRLGAVRDSAVDRLIESLDIVGTGMKFVKKASTAANIAKQMASIIDKTSDKRPEASNVTFQIYAPQVRDESRFEVLEVERNPE